ncbi:uncharacterized protein FIBRA_06086 [Fibroporia radiculosa]|uniref:Serine aminopeptidase S33 domain-containing protein n=1 Tax=Fibroporia radiculosa TaxID=599839 RepID=J4H3W1_9APHY|nr:uncharacterized protein FIBRA_06086 [Fibroporia radiculosa]CCM03934.1 predicted protein [Fibroporia radiculosa]
MSDSSSAYSEAWIAGPGDHQFYTRTYTAASAPRAAVLFVHGFADHVGRYEHAHCNWAARDIMVFAFDQRGFGRTALDNQHKSKDAVYGKASHQMQMQDIEWWVRHVKKEHPNLPLFLFGHSMGGGMVLAFSTQAQPPPSSETIKLLSGVIASSPLLLQTVPASKLLRKAGGMAATIIPWLPFPARVPAEDLSHDAIVNRASELDPLIKSYGTFRGLTDMLERGENLLRSGYHHWPENLSVTSHTASEQFFNKLDAEDKKLALFPGGYHELTNEPNGMKEKFWDECVSWILAHVPATSGDGAHLAKL